MIQTARQKAKYRSLVRRLRDELPSMPVCIDTIAVGLLERLWHCAATDAIRGDIGRLTNDEIAEAIGWHQDAATIIKILLDTRWLDRHEQYRLIVHDWHDHAPAYVRGNAAKIGGIVTAPEAQPIGPALEAQPQGIGVPNLTKPNITNSNQPQPNQPKADGSSVCLSLDDFCWDWDKKSIEREGQKFRKTSGLPETRLPMIALAELVGFALTVGHGFLGDLASLIHDRDIKNPTRYVKGAMRRWCEEHHIDHSTMQERIKQTLTQVLVGRNTEESQP